MTESHTGQSAATVHDYGPQTEAKIAEVMTTAERYGASSIVALAGVPGTGKSYVGRIASQRLAGQPERVLEVQFHPSSSYEEFVEGMRVEADGSIGPANGAFLDWNELAAANPDQTWVVLIDEFSRADVSAVLGEVMTFIEDRRRAFTPTYSRRPVRIAKNLRVIVTFNPTDRSALDIDNALLRRLRIVDFPPDEVQLAEMLDGILEPAALERLTELFPAVREQHPELYEHQMPFGHGIFSEVKTEHPDLHDLWHSRIRHMLRRPLVAPHPLTNAIERAYPWIDPSFRQTVTESTSDQGNDSAYRSTTESSEIAAATEDTTSLQQPDAGGAGETSV